MPDSRSKEFRHVLITRFNVPMVGDYSPTQQPGDRGITTEWLTHRFGFFERFCLPSVHGQTCQEFVWLVFFSDRTPAEFRERISAHAANWPVLRPVFVDAFDDETLRAQIKGNEFADAPWLITTRLDNDDALAVDFIAGVQKEFSPSHRIVLNFPFGFGWRDGRVYLDRQRSNPFTSLIEKTGEMMTIYSQDHRYLEQIAELRQLKTPPMWLQVIHNWNVENRLRGVRWPVSAARKRFALDESAWGRDHFLEFAREQICNVLEIAKSKGVGRVMKEFRGALAAHKKAAK